MNTTAKAPRAIPSRLRAGMLVAALALVGGTGCVTSYLNYTASDREMRRNIKQHERQMEDQRQRRIAALRPAAKSGDPVAQTALAYALLTVYWPDDRALKEAVALLGQAAGQGHGQAQAILGELLSNGTDVLRDGRPQPAGLHDREAGIALLQKAAVQACSFSAVGDKEAATYSDDRTPDAIKPARELARLFTIGGQEPEGRLWEARAALHCGQLPQSVDQLWYWRDRTPREKTDALALVLLTAGRKVPHAEWQITPDQMAAAERQAADLRRQVAESEREFPAPQHKELP